MSKAWHQFPPEGGSGVPGMTGLPVRLADTGNVWLAIILDMIADDLRLEIEQLKDNNEGLDCTGLEYVVEQIERYCGWALGIGAGSTVPR